MLISLSYASRPAVEVDAELLGELWIPAAIKNEARDITGCLYFGGAFFFQTLEGEDDQVYALMSEIRSDRRHAEVQVLVESDIISRMFTGWPLKLIDGSRVRSGSEPVTHETLLSGRIADINRASFLMARF